MTVWSAAPIDCAPELRLERWSVRGIEPAGTHHLVGYNLTDREGRASSAIETYDAQKRLVVTESGRVYELVGRPGRDTDGDYVWGRWLKINGSPTWRDVSEEYTPAQCAEKPKRPRRRISSSEGNEG